MSEAPRQRIQLLVIDDHAMFRMAIAEKLGKEADMTVVGVCGSGAEAIRLFREGIRPTVVLLDFNLGQERVFDFLNEAKAEGFTGRVLVVTAGVSGREAIQLIQSGIQGILHKHHSPATLCNTIRLIAKGEVFLEKTYMGSVFHNIDRTANTGGPHLTDRDTTILRLVFQGLANKEIAARLQISEGAVKSSISQLFQKLSVRTRAQLVKVALEEYGDQL